MASRGREQTRERLSRERILAAATQIAEGEGIEALSMRRLAQELDVWPMSVYRYFQDKDALLDALAAGAAGQVIRPSTRQSWRAQIVELFDDSRRSIAESSGIGARLPRAFLTPEALRLSEAAMEILTGAGFSPLAAAQAWRTLWSYTFGFATFRVAPTGEEAVRRMRAAIAGLPEDKYPALTGAPGEVVSALVGDATFEEGLMLILEGLEAETREGVREPQPGNARN
jgi:AcrR family transcriptional regulator